MNDTKRVLIKISAILSIINAVAYLISAIVSFSSINEIAAATQAGVGYVESSIDITATVLVVAGVVMLIFAILSMIGGIFLLKCNSQNKLYIPGAVLTIIGAGGLSLSAILLYVSFAIKDDPGVMVTPSQQQNLTEQNLSEEKPISNEEKQKAKDAKLKSQMEILRNMKDKGEITQEEFKQLMFELLKKY